MRRCAGRGNRYQQTISNAFTCAVDGIDRKKTCIARERYNLLNSSILGGDFNNTATDGGHHRSGCQGERSSNNRSGRCWHIVDGRQDNVIAIGSALIGDVEPKDTQTDRGVFRQASERSVHPIGAVVEDDGEPLAHLWIEARGCGQCES